MTIDGLAAVIEEQFKRVNEQFKGVNEQFKRVNKRLDSMDARLEKIEKDVQDIRDFLHVDGEQANVKTVGRATARGGARPGAMAAKSTQKDE